LGQQALESYRMQGIGGLNTFGQQYYAPLMFRRPAMAVDLVPQLATITLPDRWGQRMLQLGQWYAALGEQDKAEATYRELQKEIPDFVLFA
jgi:hypothetical protein